MTAPLHPRLYLAATDLPRLRGLRHQGLHARIWKNLEDSARWCLTQTPRRERIAPLSPDPVYENLYDRFYAIMGDLAITEHLAFTYALSGEPRYGEVARQWTLASARAWSAEGEEAPDGGKAYAVSRLLKGIAVGYDLVWERFTADEHQEIRQVLAGIGQNYWAHYFSTPAIAGPGFHTHHAVVEWSSFGVAALALLDEVPEAEVWLEATVRKFEEHLLPLGLAPDGAQVEGTTFWASTMQYRLFFMDALRRVTGKDLFAQYAPYMSAALPLASIAAPKEPGHDQDHQSVILEPSYGQLDYYAPVLLALAREYRRPLLQHLALWDHSLGALQHTRYITPHGEALLFSLGGYAYLWCNPELPAGVEEAPLSYWFPSVDEAYLRASWEPGDLLVGVRKGEVVVHAGGQTLLVEPIPWREPPAGLRIEALQDNGTEAQIRCAGPEGHSLRLVLHRPSRTLRLQRRVPGPWSWWSHTCPTAAGNTLRWEQAQLTITAGALQALDPTGFTSQLSVGNGLLQIADPAPKHLPLVTMMPDASGAIELAVRSFNPKGPH
ncbi:MAG: DUF4962 domain-containing protein [Candidatus Latescibacteria bacterium]|nr:DUF4962 domain-containing protein [Candidatus Latescibacterota bacterium]